MVARRAAAGIWHSLTSSPHLETLDAVDGGKEQDVSMEFSTAQGRLNKFSYLPTGRGMAAISRLILGLGKKNNRCGWLTRRELS